MIGPTTSSTWAITAAAQVNSGTRRQASPGARSRRTVTIMLTAKQTNPRQASATPAIQASAPFEGEKADVGERRQRSGAGLRRACRGSCA